MINVKKLKQSLTVIQVKDILMSLGADCVKENEKEIIFGSICCEKHPNEHKAKLYYYIEKGNFFCYKCSFSGDILALIQEVRQCNFLDALGWLCDELHIDSEIFERKKNKDVVDWHSIQKFLPKCNNNVVDLQVYNDEILKFFPQIYHQSWIDEGITIDTMRKYEIAYYPLHNSIVIPCRDESGNLIGIRERFLRPEDCENGKYKPLTMLDYKNYHFNFPTNQVFYGIEHNINAIKRKKTVFLLEGEKSVLKFDSWYGDNSIALAMYGSNLGKHRIRYLSSLGVSDVIIMIDSDFHTIGDEEYKQFEKKIFNMSKPLQGFFNVSVCYNNIGLNGYKFAPCDWDKETFEKLYKHRESI